ncbi:aminodeoxychorismate lyase [Psychrobacillus vulpis]|uniref:Aminodeoxychorismate lyase n=1 Tax=Psychrobacillus vulpis TaxID=2325572 RepID=A0A544TL25_9BACI|nr:aminodeoxychorismate lyase [Psychrobacillus vulpis]TQR18177.1 aminodeoxychorismate lyase [Psychrobacillus vulpis]
MDAWKDGELYRADELTISPYDHGFLYGLGFFETFRTYNGQVFLWEEHWSRLSKALEDFRITMPYDKETIIAAVTALTKVNNNEDGYFRLNISAGVHDIGLQPTSYEKPTVILFRKTLPSNLRGTEKSAVWLETVRNSPESGIRHKSHHYANNIQARFEVTSLASLEGIFLTVDGFIAEGITSNIFWVKNGKLYTPSLQTGILAGVTRDWIINNSSIEVVEGLFLQDALEDADEVFITNAVQEIVPIKNIDEKQFLGNQGPVYVALHESYVKCIREERMER